MFVRKVRTASGATAVQIAHTRRGVQTIVEHIGSAHSDAALAALVQVAKAKIQGGQGAFDLDALTPPAGAARSVGGSPVIVASRSRVLWDVLSEAYERVGFGAVGDEAFRHLVLARLIEPTSKADTVRVFGELGVPGAPSLRTIWRTLAKCAKEDWRDAACRAAYAHATAGGAVALVMYDLTTLYFEAENEDALRKVGMSKERRVDPQITVGLLVTPTGFPLEIHCFEGNKAETRTLIPVLEAFQGRHGVRDLVVVADAGMLSAANLNALEDAGFRFIVGSRITKAPYDLAEHFQAHGDHFEDGSTLESARVMGAGKAARERRVVYHYSFTRKKRDNYTLNKQIERAEHIADGTRPAKKDRFVKLEDAKPGVDWALVERARKLLGLKGYVTNIPADTLDGHGVVAAYHDLYQVERSFRMAKSDLKARPMFHHERDSIEAHLTVVFCALAIARHLQEATGASIQKIIRTLRPLRTDTIEISGQLLEATTPPGPDAQEILDSLAPKTAH
ncbi:IS1634 family transposase [Sinomonas sp. JC656]|uniref:IS1634 family transposase n=1 Tax=Sinomonas cellulolyticus TaxID=2801916 RepID=A0ABS1K3K4_9MICC|nr:MULTISPECIES: IS1634 family transposase [Sinomonas]MBL0706260.1 IS1634 family transposase [Sinomonas cellulolyticus]